MNRSTPGLPVQCQLPEFTQTHVHQVHDAIQPCHPLSSPSPPAFNLSQHQGLFRWISSSHQYWSVGASTSASVLPMNIQGWFPSGWTGWISLQSKGLSRVFSNTTVQKHHFFSPQLSLWSNSHMHTRLLEKTIALTRRTLVLQPIADFFQAITFMLKQHCDTDDLTEENKSGILGQGRGGWVSVEERLISVYHLFQVWIRSQHISCSNMTLS